MKKNQDKNHTYPDLDTIAVKMDEYPTTTDLSVKENRKVLQDQLALLQREVKKEKIPVLIIFEGWESAGKGTMINTVIKELDPRLFKVSVFTKPTQEEERRPFLWRFWNKLPQYGEMALFDRSHYLKLTDKEFLDKEITQEDINDIYHFEKQLVDDGVLIIKIFLQVSRKEQKDRIETLQKNKETRFRVGQEDLEQIEHRKAYNHLFESVLAKTNFTFSPWNIVDTEEKQEAKYLVMSIINQRIIDRLAEEKKKHPSVPSSITVGGDLPQGPLDQVDLDQALSRETYKDQLDDLQDKAKELAYRLYIEEIPSIIVFEGWDAAGKGGAIKRLSQQIDPRGYEVIPVAAPDETELNHHYMWRFYQHLPKTGHMTIFDRSWYGRVMVERIEGFASQAEVLRAYEEINQNESHWSNFGALILKYFVHISKDVQLKRFEARQNTPEKRYKITDEDWRNRERWDEYYLAINELIEKTDHDNAPWIIVPGNDKYFARITVLKSFIQAAKKSLKEKNKKK